MRKIFGLSVKIIPLAAASLLRWDQTPTFSEPHKSVTEGPVSLRTTVQILWSGAVIVTGSVEPLCWQNFHNHMVLYKTRVTDLPQCVSILQRVMCAAMDEISAGRCNAFYFSIFTEPCSSRREAQPKTSLWQCFFFFQNRQTSLNKTTVT